MATQAQRRAETIRAIVAAARGLFGSDGFAAPTIDRIAAAAGVAKGAVYHHFAAKDEIFERVLDTVQGELAAGTAKAAWGAKSPVEAIERGTRAFLKACTAPEVRRIVLFDGPAVLGWKRWREIDEAHFSALLAAAIAELRRSSPDTRGARALTRLLLGAVTEAALACASAAEAGEDADAAVALHMRALSLLLAGASG